MNEIGASLVVEDDEGFVEHLLDSDLEAWKESRQLAWNTAVKGKLRTRLRRSVNAYRGR